MSSILQEYTAAYELELAAVKAQCPTWPRDKQIKIARNGADAAVPEGRECIVMAVKASTGRDKAAVGTYEAKVGGQIIGAIKSVNARLLGPRKAAAAGKPPVVAQPRPQEGPRPSQPRKAAHRPTRAAYLDLADTYAAWCATHDEVPGDTLLAHFTQWGPSTWSYVRDLAELRGYAFETKRKSNMIAVVGRPVNGPGSTMPPDLAARVAALEAELKKLRGH